MANVQVSVSTCDQIQILGSDEKLTLVPNPSIGKVELGGTKANSTIEVSDALGKKVYKTSSSPTRTALDISDLPSGIYYLKFSDDKGSHVLKLLKE
ncbi:MAG: T9SS type A sorting domain-containing protein [bacterium]|nr:T9SS type A sorting domain-containing protein [bacterium]